MTKGEAGGYTGSMFEVHTSLRAAGVLLTGRGAGASAFGSAPPPGPPLFGEEGVGAMGTKPAQEGVTACSAWSFAGPAARLLDPGLSSAFTHCATFQDTGFRLRTTSPALLRMGGRVRMYFFNGVLAEDPELVRRVGAQNVRFWPTWVLSAGETPAQIEAGEPWVNLVDAAIPSNRLDKFTLELATGSPIFGGTAQAEWWRAAHAPNASVLELFFSPDFIGFLDSDDGISFPLYAPILDNADHPEAERCDFAKVEPIFEDARKGFRAGWRSTVIPCSNASVVYKCDSVIELMLDGAPIYLMFAVQCDGRGQGPNQTDIVENSACRLCEPNEPCRHDPTPLTRYVFFLCESPDFQVGVMGPFDMLKQPPRVENQQWVGVPQTFLSPDGEFLFFYLHRQASPVPHPQYDLNVAPIRAVRQGLRAILRARPRRSTLIGLPPLDEAEQRLGERVARHFVNLGELEFCPSANPPAGLRSLVDEHFVFCGARLHLFATRVSSNNSGSEDDSWLRSFAHYSAPRDLDEGLLREIFDAGLANQDSEAFDWESAREFIRETLLQMAPVDCPVFDIVEHLGANQVNGVWAEVNDPTVVRIARSRPTVLFFHSEVMGGLFALTTDDGCEEGVCSSWRSPTQPEPPVVTLPPYIEWPVGFDLVNRPRYTGIPGLDRWGGRWVWHP